MMEPVNVPLVPQWNTIATSTSTPDGGFLYVGSKTVNYISKIKENEAPIMKVFYTRQRVKSLDCDPSWADSKHFVTLADDHSVQIWDFEEGKVKKGHKAHVRTVQADGAGPPVEAVALCYLKNRSVLSIDSTSIIIYCVSSNTYCKNKRIIKGKDQISIVRGSPVDENIFAGGTLRGLVVVVDLKAEAILYHFRGHDSEITALSWWIKKTPKTSKSRPKTYPMVGDTTGIDDIFDIYNYQYLDDEFGAPAENKVVPSDDDEEQNTTLENEKDCFENSKFNFIEECQNLKDEMEKRVAKKNGTFDQSMSTEAAGESSKGQVTLKDCQYPLVRDLSETSYSGPSERSVDISHLSDEDSYDDDDDDEEVKGAGKDVNKPAAVAKSSQNKTQEMYLATSSRELVVWIWNVNTGASVDRIQLKGGPQTSPNTIIDLAWMDDKLLVGNPKAGEVTVWASKKTDENKMSFEKEIRKSSNRGVVNFCKLPNCEIIWTISHHREIACEDLANGKVLAKYSCAPSNISSMQERPDDMNKVAFGCIDRRIGILNTSNMTSTNISIENFSNKIESSVISLGWCQDDRFLAFGTMEGRIGVLDTEKPAGPVIMKPFYGKPVYAIEWSGKHIFACSNEKIYAYPWNNKHQEPVIIEAVDSASTFAIRENILLVGRHNGNIALYKRENTTCLKFELKSDIPFASKYVTNILFNPFKPMRIACSANVNKLGILNLTDDDKIETDRSLTWREPNAGVPSIKWNYKNENILLSCGFDGAVRVWDLSKANGEELIFVKQFDCPMLCGVFSPIDENVVITAGKATSIEMFNYRTDESSDIGKKSGRRYRDKPLGNVQWGSKLIGDVATKDLRKEKRRRRARSIEGRGTENVVEKLKDMDINSSDSKPPDTISPMPMSLVCKNQATVLHLAGKEINKYAIQCIIRALKELEGALDEANENYPCGRKILPKLFGNRTEVQIALNEELTNHRHSNTKSIGEILIPQIGQTLKEEILSRIQSKKLTEVHVALAPTISYQFWKNCCIAYASQLLEVDLTLQAIPYLMACHKTEDCINYLLKQNCYREAWVIAKLHRQENDIIFEDILKKWLDYLETTGNFEGAILLCVHTKRFQQGINILSKRGELTPNHKLILELLNKQLK